MGGVVLVCVCACVKRMFDLCNSWSSIEQQYKVTPEEIQNSIIQGFDMAVQAGPLCLEQMMGVIYIVEDIHVVEDIAPLAAQASSSAATAAEERLKKENEESGGGVGVSSASGNNKAGDNGSDGGCGGGGGEEEESKEGSVSDTASQIHISIIIQKIS